MMEWILFRRETLLIFIADLVIDRVSKNVLKFKFKRVFFVVVSF